MDAIGITDEPALNRLRAGLARIEWWRVWSGLLIVIAIGAVAMLIVDADRTTVRREQAATRERHAFEVLVATHAAQSSMASAEAALGRYAIAADRVMGSVYHDQWTLAGAQIERLRQLVARDRKTAALAARLARIYAARGNELAPSARAASTHRSADAIDRFESAGRSALIDETRAVLEAIEARQLAALQRRTGQSEAVASDASHLVTLLSATGVFLILIAGGLGWTLSIAIANHQRAEAEAEALTLREAWLREAVDERTAELRSANEALQQEMTDREAAEAQIRQMQKMDAVGRLTGGIAHDFNNMLAVVVGSLDLARRRLDSVQADLADHIDHAMEGADRAAQLTRRLLGFARAETMTPASVDPRAAIAGMSELLDRTLGERIAVRTRIARDCWTVWVDPAQLENALLNLSVNGRDAMAESGTGTLVISAGNVVLPAGIVGALPAGEYVRIAVGDTGEGMSAEVLERAFEPFFTTKPVGKGTGLGLSQVFGFVRETGGDIVIDSKPGCGTTVSIYLPRDRRRPAAAAPPAMSVVRLPQPLREPAAAGESILLVEDDARVRLATSEALAELGYVPIECAGAKEALDALAANPSVRLMVSDVVMPDTTGPELAAIVRARHPDVAVLFVTGYSGEDGSELIGEAVLRKPFTIAALDAAVSNALGDRAADVSAPLPFAAIEAAG